jgi:hypothetical protein|tara:strand:- start:17091 stop:17858 length:768 start_codon:yes stop_codon:yes gene_type:complete
MNLKNYKVNISIDDVSPHPKSSIKVLERCHELIEEFGNIKFTLFLPISYWRTIASRDYGSTTTNSPLSIDQFPDFCEELNKLDDNNFELGYHGFYHGIPFKSNNDEFQYLTYRDAIEKFSLMHEVVNKTCLAGKIKPIFRPPAWRMSPEAMMAARDAGIEILALSPKDNSSPIYNGSNSPQASYKGYDKKFNKVIYYNTNPPFDDLGLYKETEIVYHACEWDKNYLSIEKTKTLSEFLHKNIEDVEFCFMGELDG